MRPTFIFLLFSVLFLGACSQPASPQLRIQPQDCSLPVGGQTSLSLDGILPQNARVHWQASQGSIISSGLNVSAVFTAPSAPGDVTISVIIDTGTPNPPITRICHVTDPAPVSATSTSGAKLAGPPQPPTGKPAPAYTVIISEVMGNPCGDDNVKKWNQYVELYNYSSQAVDVGGWFLADSLSTAPDKLTAWDARNRGVELAGSLVTNSTIIPAGGVAVVLSPIYHQGMNGYHQPYRFPVGTVILTIAEGDRLGDDLMGMQMYEGGRDVLVLYIGGSAVIEQVISTYGSPALDVYPQNIRDDRKDPIPLDLKECHSAERAEATAEDAATAWRQVLNGSPGEVPYP